MSMGIGLIASFVGFLTVILAVWTWKKESRKAVRIVAFSALGNSYCTRRLGGAYCPFISARSCFRNACVSGADFLLSRGNIGPVDIERVGRKRLCWKRTIRNHFSLRKIGVLTTASIYLQLILGAALRHSKSGIFLHVGGAFLVAVFILWFIGRIYKFFEHRSELFNPALILGFLLMVQISLGVGSYLVRLASRDDVQPLPLPVAVTTAALGGWSTTLGNLCCIDSSGVSDHWRQQLHPSISRRRLQRHRHDQR